MSKLTKLSLLQTDEKSKQTIIRQQKKMKDENNPINYY